MLKAESRSAPERWIFGRYIVFATNRFAARRVYERALGRIDQGTRFGRIGLPEGDEGNWVLLPERR